MSKKGTIKVEMKKKDDNVILHKSSIENTLDKMPKIYVTGRSTTYSKLDKATKKENNKTKKLMKEYTKK